MKRSSAILLWISLLWSFTGTVFGVYSATIFSRLLHEDVDAFLPRPETHWHHGTETLEITKRLDFAGGTVIHVRWGWVALFIPIVAWAVVRVADKGALSTRLGRMAIFSGVIYFLIFLATVLWVDHVVATI